MTENKVESVAGEDIKAGTFVKPSGANDDTVVACNTIHEAEAKRFAEDHTPHLKHLKEEAEKLGVRIDVRSNPVAMKQYIVISGNGVLLLDGIRIQFTYDAYRLINAALCNCINHQGKYDQ